MDISWSFILSGAFDWRSMDCWFELHRRWSHCVVSLSKTLYLLFSTGSTQEATYQHDGNIVDWDFKNQTKQINLLFWQFLFISQLGPN